MPSAHVVNDRLLGSNMGAQNPRSDTDTRAQVHRILGHESAGLITLEASWNEDGRHTAARQMVRKCGDKIPMRPPLLPGRARSDVYAADGDGAARAL